MTEIIIGLCMVPGGWRDVPQGLRDRIGACPQITRPSQNGALNFRSLLKKMQLLHEVELELQRIVWQSGIRKLPFLFFFTYIQRQRRPLLSSLPATWNPSWRA